MAEDILAPLARKVIKMHIKPETKIEERK